MDEHQVEVKAFVDAKKETIGASEGIKLAMQASRIHAAKGVKFLTFSLSQGKLQGDATEDDLRKAIIGPSGNLRAPTLWIGKTLCVGFHPEMYDQALS